MPGSFKRKVITSFSVVLFFPLIIIAQEDEQGIDLRGFWDSAHHWYDINDEEKIIYPLPDQKKYKKNETTKIADNILLYQKNNGGWAKNYDMTAILTDEQRAAVINSKNGTNTTFDNGSTHSQITYLAEAYLKTKEEKYKDAALKGIEFILSAQYENGGFPQFYPDTSGYRKYITFNDGAMIGVMNILQEVVKNPDKYFFVDNNLFGRIKTAYEKGIDCILKCQINDNGELKAWCQQHDNITFLPQSARTFEPAAVCSGESLGIIFILMNIENPGAKIINSVNSAIAWLNKSKIYGIRVERIDAPHADYDYHSTDWDRIVVEDYTAPPIWSRYYELGTNRPLFCNRDGQPVYSLAEVHRERRTGYSWYSYDPQQLLDIYPEWQKKWSPDFDALN